MSDFNSFMASLKTEAPSHTIAPKRREALQDLADALKGAGEALQEDLTINADNPSAYLGESWTEIRSILKVTGLILLNSIKKALES